MEYIIFLIVGAGAGALIIWVILRSGITRSGREGYDPEQLKNELEEQRNQYLELEREFSKKSERAGFYEEEKQRLEAILEKERTEGKKTNDELAGLKADHKNLKEKLDNQKQEIEKIQEQFRHEFENMANKLLEDKSKKFTDQNKTNLESILNPLKEKIKSFEERVEQTYRDESKQRISLQEEIKHLTKLNQELSDEASNLTKALKSDSKKQGNWGEVILERILERSGLIRGEEYEIQAHSSSEDGRSLRPDVVVYLPDDKHLIIDSKVSLIDYERYVNCEDEKEAKQHLKAHLTSIRKHVKDLGSKEYHFAEKFSSPEMVLLFIPIEASFSAAVKADLELFNYAWDRKIVLVCPSTLLASLMTIASVWKQERQNRNAMEIARQGGLLYDKLVGFVEDMKRVGSSIEGARKSFDGAMNKLSDGRGNLIRRADKIKELGAKTRKKLPGDMVEKALEGDPDDSDTEEDQDPANGTELGKSLLNRD